MGRDLHSAVIAQDAGAARAALDAGVDQEYGAGSTALMEAIGQLLLERGADPNKATTGTRSTPLIIASSNGNLEVATLLLDRGADPNKARADTGATPLRMASGDGHLEMATLLLDRGADPNKARMDNGSAPLHYASQKGHLEVARLLLDRGADPNKARTGNRITPLMAASNKGHLQSAQLLTAFGADLGTVDSATPLPRRGDCQGTFLVALTGLHVNRAADCTRIRAIANLDTRS